LDQISFGNSGNCDSNVLSFRAYIIPVPIKIAKVFLDIFKPLPAFPGVFFAFFADPAYSRLSRHIYVKIYVEA